VNKLFIFISTIFFLSSVSISFGASNQVKYLRARGEEGKTRIKGLKWIVPKEKTEIRNTGKNSFQLFAILHGTFTKPEGWKLVWNRKKILLPATAASSPEIQKRKFILAIPIKKERTALLVEAIGPNGEREEEELDIVFPNWARFSRSFSKPKKIVLKKKRNFITPMLGVSRISYSETSYSSFSQTEVTARILYRHRFNSRWDFTTEGYSTVTPISTSLSGTTASFRGISMAALYSIPLAHGLWNIDLSTGVSYNSMSSSKDTFGYSPLIYPHFSPGLRRIFSPGILRLYMKYGSLGEGLSPSTSEKEVGAGISWEHSIRNGRSLLIKGEHSDISFEPDSSTNIDMKSTTISVGLTF
jgi:hypothetical protein